MYFELYLSSAFENKHYKNISSTFENTYSQTHVLHKTMSQHTEYFDKHHVCVTLVIQNIL